MLIERLAAVPNRYKLSGPGDRYPGATQSVPHRLIIRILYQFDEESTLVLGTDVFRCVGNLLVVRIAVRDTGDECI
jgi:hypothetical protein